MTAIDDQVLLRRRRQYVIRGTLLFALVEIFVFIPMIWPDGFHSTRDLIALGMLVLLALSCGLMFALVTWKFLRGWFGG
jgi:hypothetical protein